MNILKQIKHDFWDFPISLIFRPFKGYDDIKDKHEGKISVAVTLILLMGIMSIIEYQYTGFILNTFDPREMNAIVILITSVFPLLLMVLANWSMTTLLDGKGKMDEIFKLLAYALFPLLISRIISVILSNVFVESEMIFITVMMGLGFIWTGFLVLVGLIVMHQFTLSKTFLL